MYHPGGIDFMGSIPGLLKSFKIASLATLAESIPGLLESLQIRTLLFLLCCVHYTINKESICGANYDSLNQLGHHATNISVPKAENYNIFNISIVKLIQIQNSTQT